MSVAVIIALHNGAPWIGEALATLHAQTEAIEEIVVVDDASADDGPDVVREAGHEVLRSPGRGGIAARNHGLRHTRSPRVAFVDQDDLWSPRHFALLNQLLDRNPTASAAFSRVRHFDDGQAVDLESGSAESTAFDPWDRFPLSLGGLQTTSAVLIRRTAVEALGGWQAGFPGLADQILWYALSVEGAFVRQRARTTGHRMHPGSFLQKLRGDDRLLEVQREVWRHALRFRSGVLRGDPRQSLLERRLALAEGACDAVRAHREGDRDACRAALGRYATLARNEETRVLEKFWKRLVWMATPNGAGESQARLRLLGDLLAVWPDGLAPRPAGLEH